MDGEDAARRRTVSSEYRKKLLQYKELESRVRTGQLDDGNLDSAGGVGIVNFYFFFHITRVD